MVYKKLIDVPMPCTQCNDGLLVHRTELDDKDYYGFECDNGECGCIEYEDKYDKEL